MEEFAYVEMSPNVDMTGFGWGFVCKKSAELPHSAILIQVDLYNGDELVQTKPFAGLDLYISKTDDEENLENFENIGGGEGQNQNQDQDEFYFGISHLQYDIEDAVTTIDNKGNVICLINNSTSEPAEIDTEEVIGQATIVFADSQNVYHVSADTQNISFIHDEETKQEIFFGDPTGRLPSGKGYIPGETKPKEESNFDFEAIKTPGLTQVERAKLIKVLKERQYVFSTGPGDFGCTDLMRFKIDTGDTAPIAARYLPIPAHHQQELKKILEEMERNGIIEECESEWNNTLVLLRNRTEN